MITEVLGILKADAVLTSLLGTTLDDSHIYPYRTSKDRANNVIVYTFSPVSDEDAKRVDRLEIRIISSELDKAKAIDSRVRQLLKTIGDTANGIMLNVVLNGGGSLEDTATSLYHIISYYYVTYRSE